MLFATSAFFGLAAGQDDGCLEVVGVESFTEDYLTSICPDSDYATDKTVNAKICEGSTDPLTGVPYDSVAETKAAREYSLKLAILNQMYSDSDSPASCDYFCMYDPMNVGQDASTRIGFIYRDAEDKLCWDLVNNWMCFTLGYDEWLHAQDKVTRMCSLNSLPPPEIEESDPTIDCLPKVPVEMYTQEYLNDLCDGENLGGTYKDFDNAVICPDSIDPITGELWSANYNTKMARLEGLALALVNQMYGNCAAHCMYDTEHIGAAGGVDTLIAYVWKGGDKKCWHLVSAFGCITGHGQHEYQNAVEKAQSFCAPETEIAPETTFSDLLARLETVVQTLRELDETVGLVPEDSTSVQDLLAFVVEAEQRLVHIKQQVTSS